MALNSFDIARDGEVVELAGLQPSLIATDGKIDFFDYGTDWVPRHEHMLRALWPQKQLLGVPSNHEDIGL